MRNFLKGLIFLLISFICLQLQASHIVGGYLSYRCLGPISATDVEYEITMYFYRDCDNGNPGTQPTTIPISIFSGSNLISVFNMTNRTSVDTIPDDISNPCVASSPNVCVEEFVFVNNVILARNQPHQLVYQRCCKNFLIDNLATPPPVTTPIAPTSNSDFYGNTFAIEIPSFDADGCNTTPDFNAFPPILLCSGFDVNLDLSATDPDGDSLVYTLCAPLDFNRNELPVRNINGNLVALPGPDTANSPPYSLLPFASPQTATNPIPSNPQISIDRFTGRLTGIATNLGTYTIGYCVEEYRNGVFLNNFLREIQVQTLNCNPVVASAIQDQDQFCDGLSVQFINNSTANVNIRDYKWDFGIPGTNDDTSRGFQPIFTFPDTGLYTITLIANPDYPACSDTSTNTYEIRDSLDPAIVISGDLCDATNSIDFSAGGVFRNDATFQWDFGSMASINNSMNQNVNGVNYPSGQMMGFPVQLVVSQDNCSDTVLNVVNLAENSSIDFSLSDSAGCYPLPVTFTSNLMPVGSADYEWDFGDGNMSTLPNPTHTYTANGYFNVSLTVRTTSGCIDTLTVTKDSAVYISLDSSMNSLAFTFDPSGGCAPLDVQFTNQSTFEGNAIFTWTFGDGSFSSDQSPMHTYTEDGVYSVAVSMITTDKCVDTLFLLRERIINVSLDSSTNVVDFDFTPKEGCLPLTVQFSDSSVYDGTARYFWDFGDGTLDTVQNPTKTYTDTGTYTVGLLLLPQGRCKDTLQKDFPDSLRVLPVPVAQINASDSLLPLKQALIRFDQVGSQNAINHRFLVDGLEVMDDVIEYLFTDTGRFVVSYIATNGVGCEDTASAEVFIFDEFEFIIPNVITPNQDGINDEFVMLACGVYEYNVQIFNRFGEQVFESNSMNINWDGRNAGYASNAGVYFYTIRIKDFRGEYLNYSGTVTVIED